MEQGSATVGTGTDIVSVQRVARLIEARGDVFLERWFTPGEIAYCTAKARPSLHFAARFAAKEAVVKALRTGGDGPVPWRSIEIDHDEHGAPVVRLLERMAVVAARGGVGRVQVSLSHCDEYAVAVAVADRAVDA